MDEVKQLRREAQNLKEVVAEQALEIAAAQKNMAHCKRSFDEFQRDRFISKGKRMPRTFPVEAVHIFVNASRVP
jgi:hypothetical protein